MNIGLYTAHQKTVTMRRGRGLRQTKMSSVVVGPVQSPCQAVTECWVDCFRLVVQCPIEYWSSRWCRRWFGSMSVHTRLKVSACIDYDLCHPG